MSSHTQSALMLWTTRLCALLQEALGPKCSWFAVMKPRRNHNQNRRIRPLEQDPNEKDRLESLARAARYVGNPGHKRNPGDFGLTPPSHPRPNKSLCDPTGIFSRSEAQDLLKKGIQKGCISVQEAGGWPRIVWAVADGIVLEARLDNEAQGTYHGYPLDRNDAIASAVIEFWNSQ